MKHLPALLLTLATASALQAQETLKFKDPSKNPDLEGEIVTLSFKTIEIVAGGVKQPIEARRVVDIVPSASRKTPDYLKGEEAMANGNFAAAAERFERVATDSRAPESVRQLASIQSVRCGAASGDNAAVVQAAQVLRARKPECFYTQESYVLEVKAHLASGNNAGAAAALQAFGALATANGLAEWAKSVDLLQAHIAETQTNWRGALLIYRKYVKDADIADAAALGEMRSLTALADWPGLGTVADAHLKNAMGKRDFSPRILTAANTAKGDIDLNAGKAKDALLNYLQGALVLNKAEPNPEHETALARSALCCAKLFAAEKDPAKKARYRTQAQELRGDLLRLYPKTRYKIDVDNAVQGLR